jgi:galactan endo-1,6-beta-galactosidase
MQTRILLSLLLTLTSCYRADAPAVPTPYEGDDADAIPTAGQAKSYSSEKGAIGGIQGSLPTVDSDSLKSGDTSLPSMSKPVVIMSEDEPFESPPKNPADSVDSLNHRVITLNPNAKRGTWEGFGANLGPWANAIGGSEYQDTYADLFFSNRNTEFASVVLPGLGLSIVRYGIGGGGRSDDDVETQEAVPVDFPAYRHIEGYWINPMSKAIESPSFDWSRDANQRSLMSAARDRGIAHFEFFSLSPMWWMTLENTTVGGTINSAARFAEYLSAVVENAREAWDIPVSSLAPFNEPGSDRWRLNGQETGIPLNSPSMIEVLRALQEQFLSRGLTKTVSLAGPDESSPRASLDRHEELKANALDIYQKINVHTADRGKPSRDVQAKESLQKSAADKRIWVSDHSETDGDGMSLATSIVEDIRSMRATAWIYGQPVDQMNGQGLVMGNLDGKGAPGRPLGITTKHYMLAQFSRFIRPGQELIASSDDKSLIAYDFDSHRLSMVILNSTKTQQNVDIDLSAFSRWSQSISHVVTRGDGKKVWKAQSVSVFKKKVRVAVEPGSVASVEILDAFL